MRRTAEISFFITFLICVRVLYKNYIVMAETASEGSSAPYTPQEEEGVAQGPFDLVEYFPDLGEDMAVVTWAHAANSKTRLEEALEDASVMMIEADIVQGHLEVAQEDGHALVPIMAHPPSTTSDLTFRMWLDQVVAATEAGKRKGIKLDFKQIEPLKECLEYLRALGNKITFPVWLNADILPGPIESPAPPVPADEFVPTCDDIFPQATLSLGWTTHIPAGNAGSVTSGYTRADVDAMLEVLDKHTVTLPLTFPIRAAFLPYSLELLERLQELAQDSTITIWSSENDPFDPQAILTLRDLVGPDMVFLDLPEAQMTQFNEAKASQVTEVTGEPQVSNIFPSGTSIIATIAVGLCSALAALYLYE